MSTNLTPAEHERLVKLNEELGESMEQVGILMQAMGKASKTICKVLLHGYVATVDETTYDNRTDLNREVGDVKAAIDLLVDSGDLDSEVIEGQRVSKRKTNTRYMKHQIKNIN